MHRIEIENFGPISKTEISITDIVFILGEQASGKSTVAKLVYFFRTFQNEFINLIFTKDFEDWHSCRNEYNSLLRRKFTNIFGPTKSLGYFRITYTYSLDKSVVITPSSDSKVTFDFSQQLYNELASIYGNTKEILQTQKQNGRDLYTSIVLNGAAKRDVLSRSQELFNDNAYSIYIPAGRALLSRQMLLRLIQGDELRLMNETESYRPFDIVDAPTRNYIAEVSRMREAFNNEKIKDPLLRFLDDTSKEILKGSYIYINNNDFIKLRNRKLIPLSYSSSGQQEVVWLLNLLFSYAALGQKCQIIVEEPETHLHPDAQYLLVKYIAAFRNKTGSEIFITTHSPYVLSSLNNLFYADKCGKTSENSIAADSIIPKHSWLRAEDSSAYIIENSTLRDIKDEELAMIDVGELDIVASVQDAEYEKLLHISKAGKLN